MTRFLIARSKQTDSLETCLCFALISKTNEYDKLDEQKSL